MTKKPQFLFVHSLSNDNANHSTPFQSLNELTYLTEIPHRYFNGLSPEALFFPSTSSCRALVRRALALWPLGALHGLYFHLPPRIDPAERICYELSSVKV